MKILFKLNTALVLLFLFAYSNASNGPETSDSVPVPEVETAELRVTHASPDAPAVNVYVNDALALEGVDFKQSSGLISIEEPGTLAVEVRGILPDDSEVSVIGPVDLTLEAGERTDVVAFGTLFNGDGDVNIAPKVLDPVVIEDDIQDVRVSILHAAPNVADVDIYVTGPDDPIGSNAPFDAGFGDSLGPVALVAGIEYRIRVTADGSSDVVFDSGTLPPFAAGTELLIVAVENTYKIGPSPVTLLTVGSEGAGELLGVNMGAQVRVVHNSADTPAVDVLVDGGEVLDALTFPNASSYSDIEAPAGTYNVVVAADADNSIRPIDVDLPLAASASYTVIAVGALADASLEPVLTVDERRNIATAAIIEVVHGSYLVAASIPVDVYLTADGDISAADPAIAGLAYKASTDQLALTPGDYWITVTAAGDKDTVAYDSGGALTLEGGTNYTVIARDPAVDETGSPLIEVTLLTD